MTGDDLTIVLFLMGLAATFAVAAIGLAGWKGRLLIGVLFVVAVIFLAAGTFWLQLKGLSAPMTKFVSEIAQNHVSWFAVVILGLSIYIATARARGPALRVDSEAQKQRFNSTDLVRRESAARVVLGSIVDNTRNLRFVYSSTRVAQFVSQSGVPITFPSLVEELQVTAIPDAQGIGYFHSLLALAGKHENISVITSAYFRPEYWHDDLILVGSPNANTQTAAALVEFGCPFSFSNDVDCIEERSAQGLRKWPEDPKLLHQYDYALLVRSTRKHAGLAHSCIVVAGIGGMGTLAACYYLNDRIVELEQRLGANPFALLLRVDRKLGYISAAEIDTRVLTPAI